MAELPFNPDDPTARIRGLTPKPPQEPRIEGTLAKKNERTPKFPDEWDEASQEKFLSGSMTKEELEKFLPKFSFLQRDDGEIWKFDSIFTNDRGVTAGVVRIKLRNPKGIQLNKGLYDFVNDIIPSKDNMVNPKAFSLLGLYEPVK